jgi:hypothetical protein
MAHKNISWMALSSIFLLVITLACKQSGEIITPAQATQHYEATQAASSGEVSGDVEGAIYLAGSKVTLTAESYIVTLFSSPGVASATSFSTRGDEVTVIGSVVFDGTIWYKVEGYAGSGWLTDVNFSTE